MGVLGRFKVHRPVLARAIREAVDVGHPVLEASTGAGSRVGRLFEMKMPAWWEIFGRYGPEQVKSPWGKVTRWRGLPSCQSKRMSKGVKSIETPFEVRVM